MLSSTAAVASGAQAAEKLRNDRVMVYEQTLQPGESAKFPTDLPRVLVYFDGGTVEITVADGTVRKVDAKRGDARYSPPGARAIKNSGASPTHFVSIDFLGRGSTQMWGKAGLSPNYRLVFENEYTRVYEIRIPAGGSEPQHSHKDRVIVCLSGAELEHVLPDGARETATLKTGEIGWRKGGTHIGRNLGKTDLWVIAVEPK